MTLKILGGKFRGRKLCTPKGSSTRPTLAVMRKAVCDIVQADIEEANVLDLFAGSGAIGLELLSCGALSATFVETDAAAFSCIKKNVETLGVSGACTLMSYDAALALKKLHKAGAHFDLIYIDPPYHLATRLLRPLLAFLDTHPLLNPGGRVFIEEGAPQLLHPETIPLESLRFLNSRTFSKSTLHQLEFAVRL